MEDFSGYIAADELYDGPFCILSIVDNHTFKRLTYQVLEHDPDQSDIVSFFQHFQAHLEARKLKLVGITTDGSNLYPSAVKAVFGDIEHQICEFHILADLSKAILHAVAKVRKALADRQPKLPRGRPSKSNRKLILQRQRLQQKIGGLFTHRYLFVQRNLTPHEQHILHCITRGLPQLRALRTIMNEIYKLFDRRCRITTALVKLARLRRRVCHFKKLNQTLKVIFSSNLEKALTFLDDKALPATSNAVERGNRRYRKTQKLIYRVRTHHTIDERIALDLQREEHTQARRATVTTLHTDRTCRRTKPS